ncbi:response regulator transcription factor [Demequina sp. NBRC 110055]|uniref:response regulator transcription factor n=1 Tax=Demequina sp. NBRC 110055 TaxID=1570344 RepID=UPI0009FE7162|nr:response regulator transcription factor [Demequina sp. NBRC 110055]
MAAIRVLVVDDDPGIVEVLRAALEFAGCEVAVATSGVQALDRVGDADVAVLDLGLPGIDGMEVLRLLRGQGNAVPVLVLTSRDSIDERVAGLKTGADDYVVKPFAVAEVVARVEALARRAAGSPVSVLRVADLDIDQEAKRVTRAGVEISLSPTEYRLLEHLAVNAGRVLSKSQLLDHVWGYDFGGDGNVVERFVSNLRRKIDDDRDPLLHTVRGFGYSLRAGTP